MFKIKFTFAIYFLVYAILELNFNRFSADIFR